MAICCAKLPAGLRRRGGPIGGALFALSLSAISTGSACQRHLEPRHDGGLPLSVAFEHP
jgi:hypothetical protein